MVYQQSQSIHKIHLVNVLDLLLGAQRMEKRGDGVPIIMDESERLSGERPTYKLIDDSELLLTIYSAGTGRVHQD